MSRSHSPLVQAVVQGISRQIAEGVFTPGKRLPSERELAISFHVSRAIVREAIKILETDGLLVCRVNCRPVVAQTTQSRDEIVPPDYRYLGIWIWPGMGDYGASLIVQGIQRAVKDPDLRLMIANAVGDDWHRRIHSEDRFLRRIAADPHAMGAIVFLLGGDLSLPALKALRKANIPIVFIDRLPPEGFEADYVGTDNLGASRQAVRHLIDLGHRRIAYVTNNDDVSSVHERETGYRQALEQAGVEYDDALVFKDMVDSESAISDLVDRMEKTPDPPTAVVCVNDTIALPLHKALECREYKIPHDISVVGFDGLLRWIPGGGYLTSANQAFERIGEQAAELLLGRIQEGPVSTYRHILLDAPLEEKGSTAKPKK